MEYDNNNPNLNNQDAQQPGYSQPNGQQQSFGNEQNAQQNFGQGQQGFQQGQQNWQNSQQNWQGQQQYWQNQQQNWQGQQQYWQQPAPNQNVTNVKPDNNMVWAILSTICCCLPLGIVSIVYAAKVDSYWYQGNADKAFVSSRKARNWAIASLITTIGLDIIYMMFTFIKALVMFS